MSVAAFLKNVDAFQGLTRSSLDRLTTKLTVRDYKAGTAIIRRGAPGDSMYIIQSGRVRVPILDERGRKQFTAQLGVGQFFGEMALLTGEPRSADVFADTECRCLIIYKDALNELLRQHPTVASFLTEILGQRLMESGTIRQVGKYKLIGMLGRGGMAIVFEGIHPTLGRPVAVKMLAHELVYDREFADRFKNEARIIAKLRHENIVEVFDTEEAFATFFIVMEKLEGIDLEKMVETRGTIPYDQARDILRQFAAALNYAHSRGIVHRDIKPSNLIINPKGQVKLMDFGIAQHPTLEEALEVKEGVIGTPEYMSPEQALGEPIDGRSDIYSLGIVAYEMLTGELPFSHEDPVETLRMQLNVKLPDPRKRNPGLPDDLVHLIMKATAKNPKDRFQSCAEIERLFEKDKSGGLSLETTGVKTLTFLYDKRREAALSAFLEEVKRKARGIAGVIIPN